MIVPPRRLARWRVVVVGPNGQRERGTLTSVMLDTAPTPKEIADTLAEIVWRIAHDMVAAQQPTESKDGE